MTLATTLAAVEVVVAAAVLYYRTRGSANTTNARSAPAFD
jgi:NADH:ubiquinone oxidoreductase subunit K